MVSTKKGVEEERRGMKSTEKKKSALLTFQTPIHCRRQEMQGCAVIVPVDFKRQLEKSKSEFY
jgi:hypothetical protein